MISWNGLYVLNGIRSDHQRPLTLIISGQCSARLSRLDQPPPKIKHRFKDLASQHAVYREASHIWVAGARQGSKNADWRAEDQKCHQVRGNKLNLRT